MTPRTVALGVAAMLLVAAAPFAVDASPGTGPDVVAFGDAVTVGATATTVARAEAAGHTLPRAEVFYSRYRYAVGYYGVRSMLATHHRAGHRRQFGRPLVVYVSDFTGTDSNLTADGYLAVAEGRDPGWVDADDAQFVVGSRARTPTGPAVVPFSSPAAAAEFAAAHGREVREWAAVSESAVSGSERRNWRGLVDRRTAWADRTARDARASLGRPVSVVVGEDATTVRADVRRAPPNTTVRIPSGTYRVRTLTVRKPLTLRGAGPNETVLKGGGGGTPLTLTGDGAAVASLRVVGVGDARAGDLTGVTDWDARDRLAYASADAAVRFVGSNGSLVADVAVRTPANGVVFADSDRGVVDGVAVIGDRPWTRGYMGAVAYRSRIVVQDSRFVGGRDAVYAHRAHGLVVRDNKLSHVRFGVHEMYTSRSLVADNTVRDALTGVVVMTRPTGNAVVGNDVRRANSGVGVAGSENYVAENVLVDDAIGMQVLGTRSRYVRNVLARDGVGARVETLLPTNRVAGNDFVANDRHVTTGRLGPLHVWTVGGRGNYWRGAPGLDGDGDGVLDRGFRPTGPVDGVAPRVRGGRTLALSPVVRGLHALQALAPGLRESGVVDLAPLARPARPATVRRVTNASATPPRGGGPG